MATVTTPERQVNWRDTDRRVRHPLQTVRACIRRYVLLEGFGLTVLYLSVACWLGLAFDFGLFQLLGFDWIESLQNVTRYSGVDLYVRGLILTVVVLGLATVAVTKTVFRLFREFSDPAMALLLERRFPRELGDRLITAVELADPRTSERFGFSLPLTQKTIRDAAERVERLPVKGVFNWARLYWIYALCLATTLGLYSVIGAVDCLSEGEGPVDFALRFNDVGGIWVDRNVLLQNIHWPRQAYVEVVGFDPSSRDKNVMRMGAGEQRPDLRARAFKWIKGDAGVHGGWGPLLWKDLETFVDLEEHQGSSELKGLIAKVELDRNWDGWKLDADDAKGDWREWNVDQIWRQYEIGEVRLRMGGSEIPLGKIFDRLSKLAETPGMGRLLREKIIPAAVTVYSSDKLSSNKRPADKVENVNKYVIGLGTLAYTTEFRVSGEDFYTPYKTIAVFAPPSLATLTLDRLEPAYFYYRLKGVTVEMIATNLTRPNEKIEQGHRVQYDFIVRNYLNFPAKDVQVEVDFDGARFESATEPKPNFKNERMSWSFAEFPVGMESRLRAVLRAGIDDFKPAYWVLWGPPESEVQQQLRGEKRICLMEELAVIGVSKINVAVGSDIVLHAGIADVEEGRRLQSVSLRKIEDRDLMEGEKKGTAAVPNVAPLLPHAFPGIMPLRDDRGLGIDVRFVYPASPAAKAGLKAGDRIIRYGDRPALGALLPVLGAGSLGTPAGSLGQAPLHAASALVAGRPIRPFDGRLDSRAELTGFLSSHPRGAIQIQVVRKDGAAEMLDVNLDEGNTRFFLGSNCIEVRYVYPNSPADKAGVKAGDRIVKFGVDGNLNFFKGTREASAELTEFLGTQSAGQEIQLEVVRKGEDKIETLKLQLDEDRTRFYLELTNIETTYDFVLEFRDEDKAVGQRRVRIEVFSDAPPEASVDVESENQMRRPKMRGGKKARGLPEAAAKAWLITANATLPLKGKLSDDYGLTDGNWIAQLQLTDIEFSGETSNRPGAKLPEFAKPPEPRLVVSEPKKFEFAMPLRNYVEEFRQFEVKQQAHSITLDQLRALNREELDSLKMWEQFRKHKKYDEAIALGEELLSRRIDILGDKHPDVGRTLSILGDMFKEKGDKAKSLARLEEAALIAKTQRGAAVKWEMNKANDVRLADIIAILDGKKKQAEKKLDSARKRLAEAGEPGFEKSDSDQKAAAREFERALFELAELPRLRVPDSEVRLHYFLYLSLEATDNNVEKGPITTRSKGAVAFLIVSDSEFLLQVGEDEQVQSAELEKGYKSLEKSYDRLNELYASMSSYPPDYQEVRARIRGAHTAFAESMQKTQEVFENYKRIKNQLDFNRIKTRGSLRPGTKSEEDGSGFVHKRYALVSDKVVQPLKLMVEGYPRKKKDEDQKVDFNSARTALTKIVDQVGREEKLGLEGKIPANMVPDRLKDAAESRDKVKMLMIDLNQVLIGLQEAVVEKTIREDLDRVAREQKQRAAEWKKIYEKKLDDELNNLK